MRFGYLQQIKFGTRKGAYSKVTTREARDYQVTLAGYEVGIAISYFGIENIPVGNVQSNKNLATKTFRLFPKGEEIRLNLVFPKPDKTELRLYISGKAGFKPDAGDIWFLFIDTDEIWIGSMNEIAWRDKFSELRVDEGDEFYQMLVNDSNDALKARLKKSDIYARDPNIAIQRLELSGYKCEFDNAHNLFNSGLSSKPYLEAHHLVPMGLQEVFATPLDTIHNAYCLCPNCHRAIHYAEETLAREILSGLASKRTILDDFAINISDLFIFYAQVV